MNSSETRLDPLIELFDEVIRLNGRMKSAFAGSRRAVGLAESPMMVLAAVCGAKHPPTVSQIARSLGQPRQIVQRAANALMDEELIEPRDNPDHKRAPLLVATAAGQAVKRRADERAAELSAALAPAVEGRELPRLAGELRELRTALQARLREMGEL